MGSITHFGMYWWSVDHCGTSKQCRVPYSGKLSREKTFAKYDFYGENFRGILTFAMPKDITPPNFIKRNFVNSHKTAKFAKVFSLESFPLYCTSECRVACHAVISFLDNY